MSESDKTGEMIPVEVAYGAPEKQMIIALDVPDGASAYDAVILSRITDEFEAIDPDSDPMGIFSRLLDGRNRPAPKDYRLQARDRVEIYRPLTIDPNQARLARAARNTPASPPEANATARLAGAARNRV